MTKLIYGPQLYRPSAKKIGTQKFILRMLHRLLLENGSFRENNHPKYRTFKAKAIVLVNLRRWHQLVLTIALIADIIFFKLRLGIFISIQPKF